jgi:hypothetical protein
MGQFFLADLEPPDVAVIALWMACDLCPVNGKICLTIPNDMDQDFNTLVDDMLGFAQPEPPADGSARPE